MTGAYLKISDEKSLELRFTARRAEKLESELDCDLLRGLSRCQRVGGTHAVYRMRRGYLA